MKLKVLVDNNTFIDEYFVGEPAASYYIECDNKRILFDTGYSDVVIKDNVAKISVVGSGVKTSKGVAARVFRILYENNISLRLISTSEIKINVFVDKSVADIAVRKIHQDFIG